MRAERVSAGAWPGPPGPTTLAGSLGPSRSIGGSPIPQIEPMAEISLPPPDPVVPVPADLTGPGLEPGPVALPTAASEPAPLKSAQA